MPIPVSCAKCGKKLKVKDTLGGKAIRCPDCQGVLRVPGGDTHHAGGGAAPSSKPKKPKSAAPQIDEKDTLLRYEEAQKRKVVSEESEAAYREEQKKIIESYDQLAGKSTKKGKDDKDKNAGGKPALAGEKPRKVTIFTKLGDALGAIFGSLFAKYVIIVVLVCGGVLGSVYLVQYVTGYMQEETAVMSAETRAKLDELYRETKQAISKRQWGKAKDALDEIIRIEPLQAKNADYLRLSKQLNRAFEDAAPRSENGTNTPRTPSTERGGGRT